MEFSKFMAKKHYLQSELYSLLKSDDSIFEFIQAGSLDGIWYWDLEKPENEWMSDRFWTTFGYDPAEKQHLASEWQDMIFPEDLAVAYENFKKHCADPKHAYDQIVRYKHHDGSTVWVRCRGLAIRNESGAPVRMLGAHTNVTAMMLLSHQYESLFHNSPHGLLVVNKRGEAVKMNAEAESVLGIKGGETFNVSDIFNKETTDELLTHLQYCATEGECSPLMIEVEVNAERVAPIFFQLSVKSIYYEAERMLLLSLVDLSARKEIERSKENLISIINHELRTPLTAIIGAVDLLLTNKFGDIPEGVNNLLNIAQRNCGKLKAVVDDILHVDKLSSDEITINLNNINLFSLAKECVEENQSFADKYGINLLLNVEDKGVVVNGDRFRLSQVLTNYLSNAVKHSPAGADVKVVIALKDEEAVVSVIDFGRGVSEEFQPRLFERFSQDNTRHAQMGTGLGLYICKLIIEKHNGTVGYECTGNGSRFYFTIPRNQASPSGD
ncbi:ATP-binding protein [Hahella sp. HN01]|uniref:sensor histidine kinase n=1 Tax=Hahella sp. HN01 TaxID=2847262 RepID=UPI001C1F0CC0|nr:ATP-binding protein [Hahella sp. HN01]MBU6955753.1 PAS domain-containing protein [Hahella sp. HN01]